MRRQRSDEVLVSVPWAPLRSLDDFGHLGFREVRRRSDWGLRGGRSLVHHVREGVRVTWQARRASALVLSHASIEAFVVGLLGRLFLRGTAIVCFDLLVPRSTRAMPLQRWLLGRVDRFLVIRRGDARVLAERFRVAADRVAFVRLAASPDLVAMAFDDLVRGDDEPFVYSAGWAHRDWPTLLAALDSLDCAAKLSVPDEIRATPVRAGIELLEQMSPARGVELMARAAVFALAATETELPSGPLVLLDALALGKAVVATDVNGTRDYVTHEQSALLVPPADAPAMARAIDRMLTSAELRNRLGATARASVASYSVEDMALALREEVAVARARIT